MARVISLVAACALAMGCRAQAPSEAPVAQQSDPVVQELTSKAARFAPVDLSPDLSGLPGNEREALGHIVAAARQMDALFLRQVWAGNEAMLLGLLGDQSDAGRARLRYFLINKGPWSRLDE